MLVEVDDELHVLQARETNIYKQLECWTRPKLPTNHRLNGRRSVFPMSVDCGWYYQRVERYQNHAETKLVIGSSHIPVFFLNFNVANDNLWFEDHHYIDLLEADNRVFWRLRLGMDFETLLISLFVSFFELRVHPGYDDCHIVKLTDFDVELCRYMFLQFQM